MTLPCPPGQPPLSAYASTESVLQGGTISFFLPVTAAVQPPVTMQIRFMGRDPLLAEQVGIRPMPAPLPAVPYATGCQLTAPAATFQVPTGPTARSGWYEARFFDVAGNTTYVPFVARRSRPSPAQAIVILGTATSQAYNFWGGANFYNGPPTLGGYIHAWDNLAESHFSHQVSFDRPGWCWQEGGYPIDFRDVNGPIDFLEAELGVGNVDYATSTDLHFDPSLLGSYNLMISVGHDEYWSREMRDNLERFITQSRGNVCFFGANDCWWQVRFENRGPNGELIAASDRRKMVCYKMEGSPVLYEDGIRIDDYDYSKDPMWSTDRSRITTHWHAPTVNRPENRLTGVSYRNGAYYQVAADEDVQYTTQYPQHWAFTRPQPQPGDPGQPGMTFSRGTRFAGAIFKVSPEWDAALTRTATGGYPAATGEDGSPLNYLPLATCTTASGNPYDQSQPGHATMGLFRNHGVVFHAGILGWRYGMNRNWQSDRSGDVSIAQISHNVLQRLRQKGPWKFEAELHNAYFESWATTPAAPTPQLEHWIVEGGGATGLASVTKGDLCPLSGNHSLDVDASLGQVWITQDWFSLPSLQCERYTRYRVGVFVKASVPGGASVYLQTSGGRQFALAQNVQAAAWETIEGIGQMDLEGPMFEAHVVMVVNQGVVASFSDVSVFEWDTAARFGPRYTR